MNDIIKKYTMDWKDILYIIVGSLIIAFAFQVFLLPNDIISGGVSGLSIILHDVIGWDPAYIQYGLNIPLLVISWLALGKEVLVKSILGSLLFPFFVDLMSGMEAWTLNPLLATLYGGVFTGIGVGLVYKAKGSTGGTAIVAQVLEKYTNMTMGETTLLSDGLIIIFGFFVFDIEAIMYGVIALVVISRFIDFVLIGNRTQKNVLIISDEPNAIRTEILENFDRGVTRIDVRGGYNNDGKEMLMVVIQDREITALQEMILQLDDDAFVVVMSASEVMGRGFSLDKYLPTNRQQ
jgi:uncharacterized membrane-anchored protein YitT (DUF2179 family)